MDVVKADLIQFFKDVVKKAVKTLYDLEFDDFAVDYPVKETFGDYTCNVAMVLSKKLNKTPMEVAQAICYEIESLDLEFDAGGHKVSLLSKVYPAIPGFINIILSEKWLKLLLSKHVVSGSDIKLNGLHEISGPFNGKKVMTEYTDPNPFKLLHIGHVMTNCIGESLSRLLAFQGALVKRANYQGDVGVHVAKSIWGIMKKLADEGLSIDDVEKRSLDDRVRFLGASYVLGATNFEDSEDAKAEIKELNSLIYIAAQDQLKESKGITPKIEYKSFIKDSKSLDKLPLISTLYNKGRAWSLEYFEVAYKRLGTKFDYYFFESEIGETGYEVALSLLNKGIFEKSDNAIVFKAEKYGLHTRVFINSAGLPTYEAKELGLAEEKFKKYNYDLSINITDNEINEYFKVLLKALEFSNPDLAKKTKHIGHGMLKLKSGKMSSRTGKVLAYDEFLDNIGQTVLDKMSTSEYADMVDSPEDTADKIAISSIKYSILKQGIGQDVIYDAEKSLELVGNTGPYLLYTYARANSILEKSGTDFSKLVFTDYSVLFEIPLNEYELALLKHLGHFCERATYAGSTFSPNVVADYLFSIAQKFNSLYAETPILTETNSMTKNLKLSLVKEFCEVLSTGLDLLGIRVVERM